MSFQAYLYTIESKTGLTPRQLLVVAHQKGLDAPSIRAAVIVDWLKSDYDLGRGHAMALVHVIKNGPTISSKHVGTDGTHADASTELWLDGKATDPTTLLPVEEPRAQHRRSSSTERSEARIDAKPRNPGP